MNKNDVFIEKAKKIHGELFDYSKVNYSRSCDKVIIGCKIHGDFMVTPNGHLVGHGCRLCSKNKSVLGKDKFIERASLIHKNKYLYNNIIYVNNITKLKITCKIHGDFLQFPISHLQGKGCPDCYRIGKVYSQEIFLEKAKVYFGDSLSFKKVKYINAEEKVIVICPIHGDFEIKPRSLFVGKGCPYCSTNKYSTYSFIELAKEIHQNKYDYFGVNLISKSKEIDIICPEHGMFKQTPQTHLSGSGCPICSKGVESNFYQYLKSIYNGEIVKHDREILKPYEIDYLLPFLKAGFEFEGIYWHSFKFKEKNYHLKKQVFSGSHLIKLFNVREDQWINKKSVIKRYVDCFLFGNQTNEFHEPTIRVPENTDVFFQEYSYQYDMNKDCCLGLYSRKILWSIFFFKRYGASIEINHFCTKGNPYDFYPIKIFSKILIDCWGLKFVNLILNRSFGYAFYIDQLRVNDFYFSDCTEPIINYKYHKKLYRSNISGDVPESSQFWDTGDLIFSYGDNPLLEFNLIKTYCY